MPVASKVAVAGAGLVLFALARKYGVIGGCVQFQPVESAKAEAIVQKYAPGVARKYRDGWIAAARAAVQNERLPVTPDVIQCGSGISPGAGGTVATGAQFGGAAAGGLLTAGVGSTTTAAGATALTGLGIGLSAVTGFLAPIGIFAAILGAHHARAVAEEQGATCPAVESANAALLVIDQQAASCEMEHATYVAAMKDLAAQFRAAVQRVTKDNKKQCNLGCGLIRMMDAIVEKKLASVGAA